uniref:WD_REPEATS_REGION domain-containing protein n=1 Tax=Parastrongyloides trichosuri TaxID=131310 RepID=A0A0N4ZP86_PARTI
MISNYHNYYTNPIQSSSYTSQSHNESPCTGVIRENDIPLKTQFITREGIYKSQNIVEYLKIATRLPMGASPGQVANTPPITPNVPVRVSMSTESGMDSEHNRIAFNVGRELFIYEFNEKEQSIDTTKPIDKRVYKGTYPTSHAFNKFIDNETTCTILIGFSAGQVQQIDPLDIQSSRLFNEDRLIDRTAVTCINWVPFEENLFLVSHTSGCLYLYDTFYECSLAAPVFQIIKSSTSYTVYGNKNKENRNPLFKWRIGKGSLHMFDFCKVKNKEDELLISTVSHDGFLRVFNYSSMELIVQMKSYFGGLLCLDWSPDNKYIVTGGEDDMITIFNVEEGRVVGRGQGHKSWISQVKFDSYMTTTEDEAHKRRGSKFSRTSRILSSYDEACYRIGSVGFDAEVALWEITEDILTTPFDPPSIIKNRQSIYNIQPPIINHDEDKIINNKKKHKKAWSFGVKSGKEQMNVIEEIVNDTGTSLFGTMVSPRMDQVPIIEPLISKKISQDRLTSLLFRKYCMITACQEGNIACWERPI